LCLKKYDDEWHVFHCGIDLGEFEFHHNVEFALIPYLYPTDSGDE